eukprot:147311_1
MSRKRSLPHADMDEPPMKKMKGDDKENITSNNAQKPKKKKVAKPYQCRASAYLCGSFRSLGSARMEFKALFGKNKLCIAWSDVHGSDIRQAFNSSPFMPFQFDFGGMQRAAQLMNSMTTERVEIDIDHIDCIEITNGGDCIKIEIITNYPPTFTKQMSSRGKNKFNKSTDPTDGSAMRYRKHNIFLAKAPTANNIHLVENKLKNGSQILKQLMEDEVHKQFTEITMKDTYDVVYNEEDIHKDKKKQKKKKTKRKKQPKYDSSDSEDGDLYQEVSKKKTAKKKKKKKEDSDDEWLP